MERKIKAVILAGGRGKRLNERSSELNKCMLPMNGRPLISYSLDNAVRAGVCEIVIVVGYRAEDIINEFGNEYGGTRIRYAIQLERKGLVNAIETAQEAIDGHDFMTFLGDEILVGPRHLEMINSFRDEGCFVTCGVIQARDRSEISKTYAVIQDDSRTVFRLVEKPKRALNDTQGTGNCIFNNAIFDYIEETPINQKRGEKELVDMIQCAIDDDQKVKTFNIGSEYFNINIEEDIARFEKLLRSTERGES
ncbi:MAG: nucleotidyltransferase family protein [bacterium]|nr:nucleotidyltransferase family protein [bacterium]